ncbi:MAG: lactate utilization protein [Desulfobacteraceae bacterium]|nr:lactate utilization protein [Desulfobacteraceae bacterium]
MKNPADNFWKLKSAVVKEALEKNNFEVFLADTRDDAKKIALEEIIPGLNVKSVSWGGSMSFVSTGLFHALNSDENLTVLNTFDKSIAPEEQMELRRQSLLVDLFVTGTNAVTEEGQLVNLDMIGNRTGGITFGPKHVIIIVGRNKICHDLGEAMDRVKNLAAPINVMSLDKNAPCKETGFCHDCHGPDRICNTWTITEKCFPKKRVKIIIVNEDLGF